MTTWGESQIAKKQLPLQTKTLSPSPDIPAWLKFWRGITPWQEEQGQTYPQWIKEINQEQKTRDKENLARITSGLEWYQQNIVKPAAAYSSVSPPSNLRGREYLEWYGKPQEVLKAYEEMDLPWGTKGMRELLVDPLMWIPGGGVVKDAKVGAKIAPELIKQAAKFAEKQLAKGVTAETIIKGISRTIPEIEARKLVETVAKRLGIGAEKVAPKIPEVAPKVGGIVPPEKFAGNINLEKYPESTRPIIEEWAITHPQQIEAARRGVIPDAQVLAEGQRLVEEVGGGFGKRVEKWKPGQAWNSEEITALRGSLNSKAQEITGLRDAIQGGVDTTENMLKLERALLEHVQLQQTVLHGVTAEAGRALRAFRQEAFNSLKANDVEKMNELLKRLGGKAKIKDIVDKLAKIDINDSVAVNNFIRSITKPRWYDYPIEIFYNSILSGPKTQIVNFGSNTLRGVLAPFERLVTAAIEAPLAFIQQRPRQRFFGEVAQEIFGQLRGLPEGARAALKVIKNGYTLEEVAKWEIRSKAFTGKAGVVVGLPTRFLEAADQFGKAINRTAVLRSEAYRAARLSGKKGDAFITHLNDLMQNPTTEMIERSNKIADYRLFRQEPGTVGKQLIKMRDTEIMGVPALRFIVPFLRTPINLVKYGLELSPLGALNYKMWINVARRNPEAAEQIAKWVIGSTIAAGIATYIADGGITGSAPTNPNERDLFYRLGRQPYSIKIGNKWVSYQRVEPFNQVLSQVAAVAEAIRTKKSDTTISQMVGQVVATMGKNFFSQTYMSALSTIMNAYEDPQGAGGRLLEDVLTGLIPFSSLLRTTAQAIDIGVKQPTGIVQRIGAGLPGLSKNVPPKIDIFGEPITRESPFWSPIYVTTEKEDRLNRELETLGLNFGFVGGSIAGTELTEEQTRGYRVLAGNVLKDYLSRAIESSEYQSLTDLEDRKDYLNSVANSARQLARTMEMEKLGMTVSTASKEVQAKEFLNANLGAAEDKIWRQYPSNLRQLSDRIIKLENSDNRNDKIQARQLLMQHPEILSIRRKIAIEKARIKREMAIQGR